MGIPRDESAWVKRWLKDSLDEQIMSCPRTEARRLIESLSGPTLVVNPERFEPDGAP